MLEIKIRNTSKSTAFVPEFTVVGVNIDLTHGPCEAGHFHWSQSQTPLHFEPPLAALLFGPKALPPAPAKPP
jgi:hypothetical protein